MELQEIVRVLEEIAPVRLAESWDNVGLLLGDARQTVSKALLTIDLTAAVLDEAEREGCQLVVSYHPFIFKPLPRVTAPGLVYRALRGGIAVYSPHTALDVADGGTNDVLADVLRIVERAPLRLSTQPNPSSSPMGMGRIGALATPMDRQALFDRIKAELGVDRLLVAGPTDGMVHRAAVGAGACGDLIGDALAQHADLYLTGELRHHDALLAAERGMTVVCALHSNSERLTLRRLKLRIEAKLPSLALLVSAADHDPFQIV